MIRLREDYVTDEEGWESHPAFGMARIGRISSAPGQVLFQSDLRHREYVELTISEAVRKRDLRHDWVHPGRVLVKVAMSVSQFASLVASSGTEGVPVTIEYDHGDRPGLNLASRLALTSAEVHKAAEEAFGDIQAAKEAYEEAVKRKAPAAERNKLWRDLSAAIGNAAPNVDYASRRLAEHAEAVVEKSRSDVEAMIAATRNRRSALPDEVAGGLAAVTGGHDAGQEEK